jgi:hypothetical protein
MSTIELNIDKNEYVSEITIEQDIYTVELYKETIPYTIEVTIDRTGSAGISAYQVWLNEGNEGSEQDFLDSLVGAQGIQGIQGAQGIQGVAGKTAYESALDGGYPVEKTEAQFNTDLADVSNKESLSNKKTDIEANKDSNTFYATIKAIYNWGIGKFEPLKGVDDNYVTDDEKIKLSNLSGTNTGDQDLSGLQLKFIRTTATLSQTSWTEGTTFWEYEYSNTNIATTSDVTVTPTSEIEAVKAADVQPHVVEGTGKVTIYAVNQPMADIAVEIKIWK